MTEGETDYLAWFLGPKAENAALLEELWSVVFSDYIHWRRNYFPGDKILIDRKMQRQMEEDYDTFTQKVLEMIAELRRNFPFYSPRYIAHMLSDTTIPSMIGYIAGMLYNPNNVTPEAAPVTVDMEIEACSQILEMLGYVAPPSPPIPGSDTDSYFKSVQTGFGWAHMTHGGTTANLEALWVARTVRYFPLSVRDVAVQEGLSIDIKQPNGTLRDIRDFGEGEVLLIRPNESVYLLAKYVDAVRKKYDISADRMSDASAKAWDLLRSSKYSLNKGLGEVFHRFPPVIFVSGAAHYSIGKAADVLGIGRDNVILVKMDSNLRMDVSDLKKKIDISLRQGKIPLAVVAIAGTTEEGAVDPIHDVLDLREELEQKQNTSFWLHIDAAWGGYIRSLFCLETKDIVDVVLSHVSDGIGVAYTGDIYDWHNRFFVELETKLDKENVDSVIRRKISVRKDQMESQLSGGNLISYLGSLETLLKLFGVYCGCASGFSEDDFHLSLQDRVAAVNSFVQDEIELSWGTYRRSLNTMWGSKQVCSAFIAFPKADSITVDPHKMGYSPYPSGVIAFRNDRIRHFILQRAPYITSVDHDALVHLPPKHLDMSRSQASEAQVVIESFGPFILEGSRPGASASSLWLSTQTIPLTMRGHGRIVRASLLAARELHEWLVHWDQLMKQNKTDTDFAFTSVTGRPPDTNIILFVVRKKTSSRLKDMNALTRLVYESFTIQTELGEMEYSYAQPFFLSKTTFQEPEYAYDTLSDFFDRSKVNVTQTEYVSEGLVVLRATVMSPYIHLLRKHTGQNIVKTFLEELAKSATKNVRDIV